MTLRERVARVWPPDIVSYATRLRLCSSIIDDQLSKEHKDRVSSGGEGKAENIAYPAKLSSQRMATAFLVDQ